MISRIQRSLFLGTLVFLTLATLAVFAWLVIWPAAYDRWVIQPLMVKLADKWHWNRQAAREELGRIGSRAVPALVRQIEDGKTTETLRKECFQALVSIGQPAVPALMRLIKDESRDKQVRYEASFATQMIMREHRVEIPDFLDLIRDTDAVLRWHAAAAHEYLGPKAKPYATALVEALQDESVLVRFAAAYSLRRVDPIRTPLTIPAFVGVLEAEDNRGLWGSTLEELKQLGPDAAAAVPTLIKLLDDPATDDSDGARTVRIVETLAAIDKETRESVPTLLELTKSTNLFLRVTAWKALQNIDPETASKVESSVRVEP